MGVFWGDGPGGVRGDGVEGISGRVLYCFPGEGCSGSLSNGAGQELPLAVGARKLLEFVGGLLVVSLELRE